MAANYISGPLMKDWTKNLRSTTVHRRELMYSQINQFRFKYLGVSVIHNTLMTLIVLDVNYLVTVCSILVTSYAVGSSIKEISTHLPHIRPLRACISASGYKICNHPICSHPNSKFSELLYMMLIWDQKDLIKTPMIQWQTSLYHNYIDLIHSETS